MLAAGRASLTISAMMRWLVLLSTSTLAATGAAAQTGQSPLQKILLLQSTAAYQAVQERNLSALQATVTPDILEVVAEGIQGPQSFPDMLKMCRLTSFHISQPTLRILNATSAVLAYKVNQVSACGGKAEPPVTYDTDVFVYRAGKWLIATHTESGGQ